MEYITRYIAGVQQKYTQSGGVRPFGAHAGRPGLACHAAVHRPEGTGRPATSARPQLTGYHLFFAATAILPPYAGLSTLIVGFESNGAPCLYQTDPSGTYSAWKARGGPAAGPQRSRSRLICGKHAAGASAASPPPPPPPSCSQANATGRNSKTVREWLEKNYAETSGDETGTGLRGRCACLLGRGAAPARAAQRAGPSVPASRPRAAFSCLACGRPD